MRNRVFLALDVLLCTLVVLVAFTARFEGLGWFASMGAVAVIYAALSIPLKVAGFWSVGLYSRLWRYASIADLEIAMLACALGTAVSFLVGLGIMPALHLVNTRVPIGILLVDSLLTAAAITQIRLAFRIANRRARNGKSLVPSLRVSDQPEPRRVLIAGAGDA